MSHPPRTFVPWTWNSRSARPNRRPSGLLRIGMMGRDRPAIRSTCARNGATSSPNGHARSAARRAIARITRGEPACTAPTPAASGRTGGADGRSSRPAPATPPHRSAPGPATACTPSAPTATWWPDAATRRGVRSPRAERSPRSTRDRPSSAWHTDFIAGGPWSCRTCAAVLHVEPIPVATMLERALRYAVDRRIVR